MINEAIILGTWIFTGLFWNKNNANDLLAWLALAGTIATTVTLGA